VQLAIVGILMLAVAAGGGWLLVRRHPKEHATQVKAVLFGLYFWGLVFLQLILAALFYSLQK
jgi:lipopolysaccharide biosynthesis regulator YciM